MADPGEAKSPEVAGGIPERRLDVKEKDAEPVVESVDSEVLDLGELDADALRDILAENPSPLAIGLQDAHCNGDTLEFRLFNKCFMFAKASKQASRTFSELIKFFLLAGENVTSAEGCRTLWNRAEEYFAMYRKVPTTAPPFCIDPPPEAVRSSTAVLQDGDDTSDLLKLRIQFKSLRKKYLQAAHDLYEEQGRSIRAEMRLEVISLKHEKAAFDWNKQREQLMKQLEAERTKRVVAESTCESEIRRRQKLKTTLKAAEHQQHLLSKDLAQAHAYMDQQERELALLRETAALQQAPWPLHRGQRSPRLKRVGISPTRIRSGTASANSSMDKTPRKDPNSSGFHTPKTSGSEGTRPKTAPAARSGRSERPSDWKGFEADTVVEVNCGYVIM
mmetsp:Transcript_28997/g.67192  ORF Transcript_28997/g.67192 Transcript_28997/m.67192 type:complete len:390 (-) Transcript_28997:419-1588(-)